MSNPAHSSFRNEARLSLLYLAAGAAAIPAGICYALIVAWGWERWWTVLPLLALGLGTSLFAWKYLERKLTSTVSAVSEACNAQGFATGFRAVAGIAAGVSFAVLCSQPSPVSIDQTNSQGQGNAFIAAPYIL
jgi:hypothetical protein